MNEIQTDHATVRMAPISELHEDPDNVRLHDERNRKTVRASIEEFGQVEALVVQKGTGLVIGGNCRLAELRALGRTEVLVAEVDVQGKDAKRLGLVLNRSAELAAWDDDGLADLLREIQEDDIDLDALGWDDGEIEEMLKGDPEPPGEDPGPSDPPAEPVTQPGDLWLCGDHRVLCGDSTNRSDVAKAMDGVRASLMFTDPPYGVSFTDGADKNAIHGDLTQAEIPISFSLAIEDALDDNARIYMCGGSSNLIMYAKLFDHHLRQIPHVIIWDKTQFVLRPNGYHAQYEIVYYGWKGSGGGAKYWYGDRKQSDIWPIPRDPNAERVHGTQKPVELPTRAIRNSSPEGGTVYEPFLGSGSTLVACETLGRRCIGMEIAPMYVDVVLARWCKMTGKPATRESDRLVFPMD